MDRRPLAMLLALGLIGAVPAGASAASPDEIFTASISGTLSDQPSAVVAQASSNGTLSSKPKATTSSSSSSKSGSSAGANASTATATSLPYTGSDPRLTLMAGLAAILLGAGLRMRTGDARDF